MFSFRTSTNPSGGTLYKNIPGKDDDGVYMTYYDLQLLEQFSVIKHSPSQTNRNRVFQATLTVPGGCQFVLETQIHMKVAICGVLYPAAISAPNTMAITLHVS